jgi:hypothetical protein
MKSALVQDPPLILFFFKILCCVVVEKFKRSYAVKVKNLRIFFANAISTSKSLSGFRNYSLRIFYKHTSHAYMYEHISLPIHDTDPVQLTQKLLCKCEFH